MVDIKVWIVEDDRDWLRGLGAYLNGQPDIKVVHTSTDPDAVRLTLRENEIDADVVLMDIMLDGVPAGIVLAEEVAVTTGARVIMLTSMEEKEFIFRSFQAGAIDYQVKSDFESLPEAIRAASRRESPISPVAAERMREEFRRLKQLERDFEKKKMQDLITPSELELLKLIDKGLTQTEIAGRLVVSIRTIKNHVNHILKKLGAKGSKEAAQEAKEKGLF
ncbi:DNA-binding response regulator [Cohnella endophytica]|uniref:DNA-binding response regulator n=1 Tax=Cohnella endophytica TaxID=2419778 RepID=A0A494Y3J5_9BACL|nr:response regulator transcription factor [Cohnella endophytica]RKP57274.1 DNA-binding response regulator [Cohnella endophytica]